MQYNQSSTNSALRKRMTNILVVKINEVDNIVTAEIDRLFFMSI